MSSAILPSSVEDDVLERYKKHPFAKGLLPFRSAVKSLDSPVPVIYARQDGRQRWVMCDKSTDQPALFSYAAVLFQSDHLETGNYVPDGEAIPAGVEPKVVQVRPNLKCSYTYVFDTFPDLSLYEGQWAMDTYMGNLRGFNVRNLPRREYLSGHDEKYRSRFWMQTPIFLRRGPNEARIQPPAHLHEWVKQGDNESPIFRANPDHPRVWIKDGDDILPIARRTPGALQRGDVVAISFTVTYHLTSVNWFPQFHPADIIVLKPWDGDATDYSAPSLDLYSRPPPMFDGADGGQGCMRDMSIGGSGQVSDASGADGDSQGSSAGTLDGDPVEGARDSVGGSSVEVKAFGGNESLVGRYAPDDANEGFELISREEKQSMGLEDIPKVGPVAEEERRVLKPAGFKPGRVTRKSKP